MTWHYKGAMDDIRIYNRVLVPSEIKAMYQTGGWKGISCAAKGGVTVSAPKAGDSWKVGSSTEAKWSSAQGKKVTIYIRHNDKPLALYHGITDNDGVAGRGTGIPAAWGTGSGYQIMVIDEKGRFGCSSAFSIAP